MGQVSVQLEPVDLARLPKSHTPWQSRQDVVSSLRLDAVIAQAFRLSRQTAKDAVLSGNVKMNWFVQDKPDTIIGTQDIISIRGLGRLRIDEVIGKSKRDKDIIKLSILSNK